MKRKDITGIILSGGNSSRMQTNKALLKPGDKTIIEIVASKLNSIFEEVIVSANNIGEFNFLNLPIVPDEFTERGPLSGIHASLNYSKTKKNFIISCDMPLINEEMIDFICNIKSDNEIILPRAKGKIQQLCGVYSKSVADEIDNLFILLDTDINIKGSVFELLERVSKEIVDVDELPFYNENIFFNMNLPEDYKHIKKYFEQ